MCKEKIVKAVFELSPLDKIIYGELIIIPSFSYKTMQNENKKNLFEYKLNYVLKHGMYFVGSSDYEETRFIKSHSDAYVFALLEGPYTLGLEVLKFEVLMKSVINKPAELKNVLNSAEKHLKNKINLFKEAGANGIVIGDDIAYGKGLIFSLEHLKNFFEPIYKRITTYAKKIGLNIIFHSCGNTDSALNLIKHCGFEGFHGFDKWSNHDFLSCQLKDFVFMGGWDYYYDKEIKLQELDQKIQDVEDFIKRGNSYLLCSSGGIEIDNRSEWVSSILKELLKRNDRVEANRYR